jgi:hypothetical protein
MLDQSQTGCAARRAPLLTTRPPAPARAPSAYAVEVHTRRDVDALLPGWRALHRRAGAWSPFSDPDAQLAWCDLFVPAGRERIVAVRRTATGDLVAVVPLFEVAVRAPGLTVRTLQAFGALHEPLLHELPEVLVDPACARPALAAVVGWLARSGDWDWVELPLRQDQGWFESRWATDAGLHGAIVVHKDVVPTVVLPLPSSGEPPALKRNLRESLRRSRNRIDRLPGECTLDRVEPGDPRWEQALDDLRRLHAARARMGGVVAHDDVFDGTSQTALLQALAGSGARTRPRIHRLVHDGTAVAALLTLDAVDRTWLAVSGVTPAHWALGAVTLLQWEAVQEAVRAGRRAVCFPTGVDTAKLRWSEDVRLSHVFVLVGPRRRSRLWFRAYWLARGLRSIRSHERRAAVRPVPQGSA